METVITWIKANKVIAIIAGAILALFAMKKFMKTTRKRRRKLPRSVGMNKITRARRPRKQYTKGGKAKKPWQIKGSLAARRHMAQLRKRR